MNKISRISRSLLLLLCMLFYTKECTSKQLPTQTYQDAAIYPGLKKTGLKLMYSELGTFDDLTEATQAEGFLKIGLFCIERGAFILYRKPFYNIDNADDFKVASGANQCFTPAGIESAQPIGPLAEPRKNSITFFTGKNFASVAYPTAKSVMRSFFSSIKSSVKSLIIIGKKPWTIHTEKGEKYCVNPAADFDNAETYPICMLSDLSATKIKVAGVNILKVLIGCDDTVNVTIDINSCSYWGTVPAVDGESNVLIQDNNLGGRSDADGCSGGGDQELLLTDTLYYFKSLITGHFDKDVVLDFTGGATFLKWKLEMLDLIWDIAKLAIPKELVSVSYMNKIRELFVSDLSNAWRRHKVDEDDEDTGITGGMDQIVVGLLTEYDYRGLLYQTNQCIDLMTNDTAKANWAAWQDITDPEMTEEPIWKGLVRNKEYNIVIEMTWVILNMVGGLCHKLFGFAHNYWALYIHFVVNMYLAPVADVEWIKPAEFGDTNFVLGGDMAIQYDKLAISASLALFAANSFEPFERPIAGTV